MREFKKVVYIGAFIFLGLLGATLVHAGVEMWTLHVITTDMATYGESFVWQNWDVIHRTAGSLLWFAGFVVGLWLGLRYWRIIYVERKRGGVFTR